MWRNDINQIVKRCFFDMKKAKEGMFALHWLKFPYTVLRLHSWLSINVGYKYCIKMFLTLVVILCNKPETL